MMGKGEGRHVVRNKVMLVNVCCVVSDPTSYNNKITLRLCIFTVITENSSSQLVVILFCV